MTNILFLPHTAFTQMRPDMVKFCNFTKKVILIKLTCPYEENMEKYLPLKTTIKSNSWSVYLLTVEVGPSGFGARSVMCYFHVLGLHNPLNLPSKS